MAAPEAVQTRFGRCSRWIGDFIALIENQLNFFIVNAYPTLDLLISSPMRERKAAPTSESREP